MGKLRQAHREKAALEGIKSDYWEQLDEGQKETLNKRLETAERAALEALGPAYTIALRIQGKEIEDCHLSDARKSFPEHLGYVWTTLVEDEEWILRRVGSVTLGKVGLIPEKGAIRVKDAVNAFLRFTDKPMISSKVAVTEGLSQACADGLLGIGRGGSPSTLQASYCEAKVSIDPSEDGIWIIPPFSAEEPESEGVGIEKRTVGTLPSGTTTEIGIAESPTETGATGLEVTPSQTVRRFVLRGTMPVENYGELFRCFVGPAVRMNLKHLKLGIQFEMETFEDSKLKSNDSALKAMQEAARQLGLKFEVED